MIFSEAIVDEAALGWFQELSCNQPKGWPQPLLKVAPLRNLPALTGVAPD